MKISKFLITNGKISNLVKHACQNIVAMEICKYFKCENFEKSEVWCSIISAMSKEHATNIFVLLSSNLLQPAMRDKSVETLSFQRVFWCMLFNSYRLAQKTIPPSPKQCWISYCTNDGLCSGTTLNWGEGL